MILQPDQSLDDYIGSSDETTPTILAANDALLGAIPVLGYLDDVVIVPLGILAVVKLIPPDVMAEHRAAALAQSERPKSPTAAVIVLVAWIVLSVLAAWIGWSYLLPHGWTQP